MGRFDHLITSYESQKEHLDSFLYYVDVSSGVDFKSKLEQKLSSYISQSGTQGYKQDLDKQKSMYDGIITKLESEINLHDIQGVEGRDSNIIVYSYDYDLGKEQEFVFELKLEGKSELFVGDNIDEIYAKKIETKQQLGKHAEQADLILQVMDYIFKKNDEEWFDELNHSDVVDQSGLMKSLTQEYRDKLHSFGVNFSDMNLLTLQNKFEEIVGEYSMLREGIYDESLTSDVLVLESKQKYLDMVMGIGDKYEGGAKFLNKSENLFNETIDELVNTKSIEEVFQYLVTQHETIDTNDYQSSTVEKSYKMYIEKLHGAIFQKLKDETASEKQFLDFAKIITGRYQTGINTRYVGKYDRQIQEVVLNDIDDNLKDQDFSNEVILYIVTRSGGLIDKINQDENTKLIIEDEEVGNLSPQSIISESKSLLETKVQLVGGETMQAIGFGDLLTIRETNYDDLSIDEKIKISILARLNNKLKEVTGTINKEELSYLFKEVSQEANKKVVDELNDNFDASLLDWNGKNSEDYDHLELSDTQKELFDLFQDINGNGLFDFSDNTWGYAKIGAKITVAIAAGIAIAPFLVTAGVGAIATGAVVGLTATVTSIALNPQGYDTVAEAGVGLSGELLLGTATGAAGGWLVKHLGVAGAKLLSRGGMRNSGIFAGDLVVLGLGVEILRNIGMHYGFHNQNLFNEKK